MSLLCVSSKIGTRIVRFVSLGRGFGWEPLETTRTNESEAGFLAKGNIPR
jgi:hypothetical protein